MRAGSVRRRSRRASGAPRPAASAGHDFARWFAVAAARFPAPKVAEWTDGRAPFVAAGAAAVCGAAIVRVRQAAPTVEAAGAAPVHAPRNGVAVYADRPRARTLPAGPVPAPDPRTARPTRRPRRARSVNSTMRCVTSHLAHDG